MNPSGVLGAFILSICAACTSTAAFPEHWFVRASGISNSLHSVAYHYGSFLIAGNNSTVLTSSNGVGWYSSALAGPPLSLSAAARFYIDWYVGGAGVIFYSRDGVAWTNVPSIPASQSVDAILAGSPAIAFAHDSATSAEIAYSVSSILWSTNVLPSTNAIYAAILPVDARGAAYTLSLPYIAVGERGTILTSSNGTAWTLRNSGTTAALRGVVYHQGKVIAAGDGGTVVYSSNAVTWSAGAPTSFNVRGLASSGLALIAVGEHAGGGRVQVSDDGITWPGDALVFSNALNSAAFGQGSFVAVGDGGLVLQSSYVPDWTVNAWTNSTSGYWEENFWTWGRPPSAEQSLVALTNAGWKALAIGQNTTANYSNTMTIGDLMVSAPDGSYNQLLLNYAGTNVPLTVGSFTLGTNASLVSYYSSLQAQFLSFHSPVLLAEETRVRSSAVEIGDALTLSNAHLSADSVSLLANSVITQEGGRSETDRLVVRGEAKYLLKTGLLSATNLALNGELPFAYSGPGTATFLQSGGSTVSEWLGIGAWEYEGEFTLSYGTLSASRLQIVNGRFTQTGGTNTSQLVSIPSRALFQWVQYSLSNGTFSSGDLTLGTHYFHTPGFGTFLQSGGFHSNSNMTLMGVMDSAPSPGSPFHRVISGIYNLSGGLLVSGTETIAGGTFNQSGGTNEVINFVIGTYGDYNLTNGVLSVSTFSNHLGAFRQQGGTLKAATPLVSWWGTNVWTGGTREFGFPFLLTNSSSLSLAPGTTLRYADSSKIAWPASILPIYGWSSAGPGGGGTHLFFGASAQGLTAQQIAQLVFVTDDGSYPARILATGEVVPDMAPRITVTRNPAELVLSWDGGYELISATNVLGPYYAIPNASSPFTNPFVAPEQYFRLRSPVSAGTEP